MSFPSHGSYQDSGVDWIGEVPADWEVSPLKAAFSVVGGATPKSDVTDYWDGGVPWVTPGDLSRLETPFIGGTIRTISEDGLASCAATRVPAGSVILSTRAPIGSLGITTEPATTNQGCKALVPKRDASARFLAYALSIATTALNVRGKGTTFLELSGDELARFKVPLPSAAEQTAIAAFLDRETGKIDVLVEAQRRLIELLKEKRQAVISHAITKGLDPAAPMKDSGVEWLGEVPTHWEVVPLKRDLAFLTSGSRGWAEHYADDGALFIRIGNLTRERVDLDLSDIQRVAVPSGSEGERTRVQSGDVLFSITAFLGSVAVVPAELETAYVSQHVALARLAADRLLPKWVAYVTLSRIGKTQLEMGGYGGTKIQLSLGDVGDLLMTVPPLHEQAAILAFLDAKLQEFSALESEAENAISLLQERRAALISAAVTGKIDVRGLVADQTERNAA